jgi:hypothetical protein
VLFERPAGKAEEARSFGRAQKAQRQAGERIGHDRVSVFLTSTAESDGGPGITVAKKSRRGG